MPLKGLLDYSHGVHNDVDLALTKAGYKPLIHVALIASNLYFGPCDEAWRKEQLHTHLKNYTKEFTPKTADLFLSVAPRMIETMRDRGVDLGDDSVSTENAWDLLVERAEMSRAGNTNQFGTVSGFHNHA